MPPRNPSQARPRQGRQASQSRGRRSRANSWVRPSVDDSTILSVVTDPPNSTTATVPANYIEEDDDVIKRENLPRRKNLINKHGPVLPTAQSTITSAFGTLQQKAKKDIFTRQVFDAVEYATKTGVMSTLPVEHNKQPWYSGWWSGRYERTAPTIKILTSAESDVRYAAEMAGNLLRLRAHPSHRAIEAIYNTLQSELEKIGEAKDATKKLKEEEEELVKTAFTRSRGYTLKNLAATLAVGTLLGGTTAGYFLGGFSTCPAVPTVTGTTASPVSGVSTKLASCRTELSRAQQNTKQCQGDLSRCETKADTYVGQLTDARASLAQRDREVSQYKSDLRTSNAGWDETNRSISDYVWKLTQCEDKVRGTLGELEESTDNESRNYGSLSDCQARLLTQGENTEKTDESLMAGRDTATRNTDTTKMRYQSQTSGKKTGTQSTQTTKRPKERSTGGRSTATRTTKVSEPTLTMGRSTAAQKTGRVQDTQPSRGLLNKSYKDLMDEGTDETDDQIWDRFARILGGL